MALNINGTTGISGVDGSASAASIAGTDANTGLSFASDTVNINTGGSTRATIDSSGNLKANSGFGSVTTIYGVRAWLKMYWNSGTPTISGSGNVSSLTDTGTGVVTVNFSTNMPDVNYSTCVSGDEYGSTAAPLFNVGFSTRGYTTSAVTIGSTNFSGTGTDIKSLQLIVVR
ncbi:hypothetical protein [Marinobacter sp.]|jgi:hypothetical protein|uniref:hypothetical protein n=1 Tax=Marinobacter sp. TaxID=50741 RepID=UPI002352C4C3|nr:hypothetical protein [Marinobacter sp.]